VELAGAAHLELVSGVAQLRPEDAMFEAMLRGWRAQQVARGLRVDTIDGRELLVRRFLADSNEYPWGWGPAHVEEWIMSLTGERQLAASTIRSHQVDVRLFSEYITDARYGWVSACEEALGAGAHPVAIFHEWNTIAHLNDYEGRPEVRPFSREELQLFFDYADDQVERAARSKHKGALTAYRDATLFKVMYGWGLRRTETAKLDVVDWGPEPGGFGVRALRDAGGALWQSETGPAAKAAQCGVDDGMGGRRGGRLRGERPAAVRLRGSSGVVGDRARWTGKAGGDQRPFQRLPRRVGFAGGVGASLAEALVCDPFDGERGGPSVSDPLTQRI